MPGGPTQPLQILPPYPPSLKPTPPWPAPPQIYGRQNISRSELLRQSEARNGNPTAILRSFGLPV